MKLLAYKAYVVEIKDLRKHINADRLQIATVFGNDVVVGLDVKIGDKMIYFPVDGSLSEEFATTNDLVRRKDESGNNAGGYLDPEKRNVKAIRFRGEKSDGMLSPISSLYKMLGESYVTKNVVVGDSIDIINGKLICEKYIPKTKVSKNDNKTKSTKKISLKEIYPLFQEHKDTSQLAYSMESFRPGDILTMTLKVHGTSQRSSYTVKNRQGILNKILGLTGIRLANKWETISGTRRVILNNFKGGYYGSNSFRQRYHDLFGGKLKKGETVYYEVVGYTDGESPIMSTANNSKINDKSFRKQYGDTTVFSYGCEVGQSDIYVYRMTFANEDGEVVEYPTWLTKIRCEQMNVKHVPILDEFVFTTPEDLMERVKAEEDGTDPIGKTHIREGVVVRIENREGFSAYKQKGFNFKVLESIIKDEAEEADMEEAQDLLVY